MLHIYLKKASILAVLLSVLGCEPSNGLDQQLNEQIIAHKLSGDPAENRDLPSISDPLAQLGKQLFFTKALGEIKILPVFLVITRF